ncbi:hypothetical protein HpBT159_00550 [Helicobacter pylori]
MLKTPPKRNRVLTCNKKNILGCVETFLKEFSAIIKTLLVSSFKLDIIRQRTLKLLLKVLKTMKFKHIKAFHFNQT